MANDPSNGGEPKPRDGHGSDALKWWRDARYITALGALLALIIPGTAAINGLFRARLDKQEQVHEIRLKYLDRAIDPTQDAQYRESVLKFLLATLEKNDPMRNWAEEQSRYIRQILDLKRELTARETELVALEDDLRLQEKLRAQEKRAFTQKEKGLVERVAALDAHTRDLRSELAAAEAATTGTGPSVRASLAHGDDPRLVHVDFAFDVRTLEALWRLEDEAALERQVTGWLTSYLKSEFALWDFGPNLFAPLRIKCRVIQSTRSEIRVELLVNGTRLLERLLGGGRAFHVNGTAISRPYECDDKTGCGNTRGGEQGQNWCGAVESSAHGKGTI